MNAYLPESVRTVERYAKERAGLSGGELMGRAASALYRELSPRLSSDSRVVILCGSGSNGGDGWALARLLRGAGDDVTVVKLFSGEPKTAEARQYHDLCREENVAVLCAADSAEDFDRAQEAVVRADAIVDAVFGIGFSGAIGKDTVCGKLLQSANHARAFRLAADVPSGACAATGSADALTFRADVTLTFIAPKAGLYSYPARSFCGDIRVAPLDLPQELFDRLPVDAVLLDDDLVRSLLPARPVDSHKGSFGRLLVVCGSADMTGAAHLACLGALRCGVGLVCLAGSKEVTSAVKTRLSEPIYLTVGDSEEDTARLIDYANKNCSAVLVGCGLGTDEKTGKRVRALIKNVAVPLVLDADGINAVAGHIHILSEAESTLVLTPHPAEFSRLTGQSVSDIQNHRMESARAFAKEHRCVLLLKGAGTIVCDKGERLYLNTTGGSALAKGGSGDVLSGMIAAFLAQGAASADSAVLGAYLHGKAGDALGRVYSSYGVLPSEIPAEAAKQIAALSL